MSNYMRVDGEFPTIVSERRGSRPHLHGRKLSCPFCPGNEDLTPPEVLRRARSDGSWYIRVFPNAFPFVQPDNEDAYGYHDVVVETDDHSRPFHELPVDHIAEIIDVWGERECSMYGDSKIAYVSVFKNHGVEAGASIPHPHSQLAGIPFIPPRIEYRLENYPPSRALHILSGEYWELVAPTNPRFAYEVRIQPNFSIRHLYDLDPRQRLELAQILKGALLRVSEEVDAYNVVVFTSPKQGGFPLHIEIYPRKNRFAGFELGTGAYVVPVSPETTVDFYKTSNIL